MNNIVKFILPGVCKIKVESEYGPCKCRIVEQAPVCFRNRVVCRNCNVVLKLLREPALFAWEKGKIRRKHYLLCELLSYPVKKLVEMVVKRECALFDIYNWAYQIYLNSYKSEDFEAVRAKQIMEKIRSLSSYYEGFTFPEKTKYE